VTIRDRDSLHQIRIPIDTLRATLTPKLAGEPFDVLPPGGSLVTGTKSWRQRREAPVRSGPDTCQAHLIDRQSF
jgi:hypothetical protein